MTLSPVFRSKEAFDLIRSAGYLEKLQPSIKANRQAILWLRTNLAQILPAEFIAPPLEPDEDSLGILQEHFFLILFHSIYNVLRAPPDRLDLYTRFNQCVKGIITSADNLFDGESKTVLPLKLGPGPRLISIVQLICSERLLHLFLPSRSGGKRDAEAILFLFLERLVRIGQLEGREEQGIEEVPDVNQMIEKVHRLRGGQLFSLAFVAPRVLERCNRPELWLKAEEAVSYIGTAFQMADDLTDFEEDLHRRSHNLLRSQITHHGTPSEKRELKRLLISPLDVPIRCVEDCFLHSARKVLLLAEEEAHRGFEILEKIGFWMSSRDAPLFVRAIVNIEGSERIDFLTRSVA